MRVLLFTTSLGLLALSAPAIAQMETVPPPKLEAPPMGKMPETKPPTMPDTPVPTPPAPEPMDETVAPPPAKAAPPLTADLPTCSATITDQCIEKPRKKAVRKKRTVK